MTDHSTALESLAAEHCRDPLAIIEMFLERAALNVADGMSRDYAERTALADIAAELSGVPVERVSPAGSASAAVQMQTSSSGKRIAKQTVSRGEQ